VSPPEEHPSFIKTPRQLVIVIVLAFLIPIVGILLIVQLITSRPRLEGVMANPDAVAARIQPVGRIEFAEAPADPARPKPPAAKPEADRPAIAAAKPEADKPAAVAAKPAADPGKKLYETSCVACHATGVAGAPRLGDKAAWTPRLQAGMDALVQATIKGKGAMPPKGGNPALSDAEVRAAVEYLVTQSK
jgi:cytochrome c5